MDSVTGKQVWDSKHFGPDGSIAKTSKEYAKAPTIENSMSYACALYSAIGYCVAKIKYGKLFWEKIDHIALLTSAILSLRGVVLTVFKERQYEYMTLEQKEPFMVYLLVARFVTPYKFFAYRKTAIKLGEKIAFSICVQHSTFLLAIATLSRMWFYKPAKRYHKIVWQAITPDNAGRIAQVEVGLIDDLRTVNRLARKVGHRYVVKMSASLANSKDVMIKSGMS